MIAFPLAAAAVAVDAAAPAAPVPPAAAGVAARSRSPAAAGRCPSSRPDGDGASDYRLLSSDRLTEMKKVGTLIVGSALHCYPLTVTATLPPLEF